MESTAVPPPAVPQPAALAPPTTVPPSTTTTTTIVDERDDLASAGGGTTEPDATSIPNDTTAPPSTTTTAAVIDTASDSDQPAGSEVADPPAAVDEAYQRLLQQTELSFLMVTTTASEFGNAASLQRGVWINGIGSETSIVFELDEDSTSLIESSLTAEGVPTGGLVEMFASGFRYRFFTDDLVWVKVGNEPWIGTDPAGSGLDAFEPTGDAATYLEPFVDAIAGLRSSGPLPDGSTRYDVVVDADAFVPLVAQPQTAQNIYDRGWDGVSDELIDGHVTISADGDIVSVGVDQTRWWNAGWEAAGVDDVLDGTTVGWTMTIETGAQALEVPCTNPTAGTDADFGTVQRCAA
ncbi:MAG: hypothetical protein AAGC53_10415 [Actinomycetota bacterium]